MSVKATDVLQLGQACDSWLYAWDKDSMTNDPQAVVMDGTQDEAVVDGAVRLLLHALDPDARV